jgi:hypothetical protein
MMEVQGKQCKVSKGIKRDESRPEVWISMWWFFEDTAQKECNKASD